MTIDLRGKWALVTGSSRGIGVQIAQGLAQHGCNLVLHSRHPSGTDALARTLATQVRVVALAAELSDQSAVDALAQEAQRLSGGIHILYNNAAIMTPYRQDLAAVTAEDYRRSFEVNVIAPIRLTFALLPGMRSKKFGRIIQVTSGIKNEPELMAYAASKAALDKFVHDMAPRLLGTGVTMNLLDPGWLRTDLGGPKAPNAVESVLPGALVPALAGDDMHGQLICAQDYAR
jgi:NAD(P)-dependent dehydrogenase (short-subunit alcohol dehydrogenase family)